MSLSQTAFAAAGFNASAAPALARFFAPVVLLLALPLAVVVFAFMLGGAAARAVIAGLNRKRPRPRARAARIIEGDYVVVDESRRRT